jgi:hypothetical protein
MATMGRLDSIVIFCRDQYVAGPFWAAVLGLAPIDEDAVKLADRTLEEDESVYLLDPAGRTPPVWITPHPAAAAATDPGLVHFEVRLDDLAEIDRLKALGAEERWTVAGDEPWTVLAAPDGVLFCARHPVEQA